MRLYIHHAMSCCTYTGGLIGGCAGSASRSFEILLSAPITANAALFTSAGCVLTLIGALCAITGRVKSAGLLEVMVRMCSALL